MEKSTAIIIIKCVLVSTTSALQTLINVPQLDNIKIYLSIATGAIFMFSTMIEKKVRMNYKKKKQATTELDTGLDCIEDPQATVIATEENVKIEIDGRSLGFIHNLVQPQNMDFKGKSPYLPERYSEYTNYTIADFDGQREITGPNFGFSINSNTPATNFV
jgi:hypothetical protein